MRISDWSSDVCSSDLIAQIIGVIDDARQVGVLEIDARPVMMRRADEGAGDERGRGLGHRRRAIAAARLVAKPRSAIRRSRGAIGGANVRTLAKVARSVIRPGGRTGWSDCGREGIFQNVTETVTSTQAQTAGHRGGEKHRSKRG